MADTRKPTADEQAALSAVRGGFYRPVKHLTSLRLDADLLAWFQRGGNGYQTRINAALREYVERHQR